MTRRSKKRTAAAIPTAEDFDYELNLFAMQMQKYQYRSRVYPDELWLIWSLLDLDCYDVNARDDRGVPPIVYAAKRGSTILLRLLLRYKADISATTKELETALIAACRKKRMGAVRFLLERGARTDSIDKAGLSALRWAVQHEHVEMLQVLLRHRASVLQDSYTQQSALERARSGTSLVHQAMVVELEQALLMDRRKFLEELQEKQRQQEINAISAFRKKSTPAVIAAADPKPAALSSLMPKALRRSSSARSRRERRVLPADARVLPVQAKQDTELKATPAGTGATASELSEAESDCHRWVRVSKGRWMQLRQQDTSAVIATTTTSNPQGGRVEQPQGHDSSSDTSTVVELFQLKEKEEKAVQPRQLIYNEAQWQTFISSSPTNRSGAGSTPVELTIEELA